MGWLRKDRTEVSAEAIAAVVRRNVGLSRRLPPDMLERLLDLTAAMLREK